MKFPATLNTKKPAPSNDFSLILGLVNFADRLQTLSKPRLIQMNEPLEQMYNPKGSD